MNVFNIDKVYNAFCRLDKAQRKDFIARLNAEDIPVSKIEAYIYKDAPGIKHLFFYLEGNKEAVPYFLLEERQLYYIQKLILSY